MYAVAILEERNYRMIFLWEIKILFLCEYLLLLGKSNIAHEHTIDYWLLLFIYYIYIYLFIYLFIFHACNDTPFYQELVSSARPLDTAVFRSRIAGGGIAVVQEQDVDKDGVQPLQTTAETSCGVTVVEAEDVRCFCFCCCCWMLGLFSCSRRSISQDCCSLLYLLVLVDSVSIEFFIINSTARPIQVTPRVISK